MVKIVRSKAIPVLEILAWLEIIGSIGAAFWFWKNISPYGAEIGLAVLFQGIFFCALFLVFASIADNIASIAEDIRDFKYKGMTEEEMKHFETAQKFRTREDYEKWRAKRLPSKADKQEQD
jgi:hypothetical protein